MDIDELFKALEGVFDEDEIFIEKFNKNSDSSNIDSSGNLYDMDSLMDFLTHRDPSNIKVPYPDYLKKDLKRVFKKNKPFIDALENEQANAINHLDDVIKNSKDRKQISAYTDLYQWLIENDIEFQDPNPESSEDDPSSEDSQMVEGDDNVQNKDDNDNVKKSEEKIDSEESNSQQGDKGKNQESEKGNNENNQDFAKSEEQTNNLEEKEGGKVQQESEEGKPSSSKEQSQDSQNNISSKQKNQSNSQQNQSKNQKKEKKPNFFNKALDKIKDTFNRNKDKKREKDTDSGDKGALNKTQKESLKVMEDIIKELEVQENDNDEEKIESEQDNERHDLVRPGGRQISRSKAEEIVKKWIERMAISGVHMKVNGYEKWDKRKIAKHVVTEQEWKIPEDKYKHSPDKVMFMLDFSGSCSWISKTFAQLGYAATQYDHVIVAFGGYEGYVQGFITKETDINNIDAEVHKQMRETSKNRRYLSYYSNNDNYDDWQDISLGSFLKKNNNIKTVIILGDFDGTERYVDAYLRNRHVKFTWFLCEKYTSYRGCYDLFGLKNYIHYFDGSVEGLAKLVTKIK